MIHSHPHHIFFHTKHCSGSQIRRRIANQHTIITLVNYPCALILIKTLQCCSVKGNRQLLALSRLQHIGLSKTGQTFLLVADSFFAGKFHIYLDSLLASVSISCILHRYFYLHLFS